MLGYLRPQLKNTNPKIKEQYRAVYCGLCHSLKKIYGYRGISCLNYEITFIFLLILSVNENDNHIFHGSCSLTPFVRVPYIDYLNADVKTAANISVIVSCFEIKDNVADGEIFIWRIFDRLLNKLNAKATKELSEFEKQIQTNLRTFYDLEKSNSYGLDEMMKACGDIVESITCPLLSMVDGPIAEMISKIVNSIGQWIYLVDACDDFQKDIDTNNFNPLSDLKDYRLLETKISNLENCIIEHISMLPLNKYGDLLQYFSETCIPQSSKKIFEKYKRGLTL